MKKEKIKQLPLKKKLNLLKEKLNLRKKLNLNLELFHAYQQQLQLLELHIFNIIKEHYIKKGIELVDDNLSILILGVAQLKNTPLDETLLEELKMHIKARIEEYEKQEIRDSEVL